MCLKGFIFLGTDHYNWPSTRVLLEVMTSTSKQIRDVIPSFENHYANLEEFHNQAPRINHDFAFRGGETLPMACFFETQIARVFSLIKVSNTQDMAKVRCILHNSNQRYFFLILIHFAF